MKKIGVSILVFSITLIISSCNKNNEQKFDDESNDKIAAINNSLGHKLCTHKWNMAINGQSFGTIQFNADGTCVKTAEGGLSKTNGNWKLEGDNFTLSFPTEGDPFTGQLSGSGDNMIAKFMDGAITYTYSPLK
jgi:hypothetical protein